VHRLSTPGYQAERLELKEFKRPFQIEIDPQKCLLAQGLMCLGPPPEAVAIRPA
jgi:coenzyme F420-reducing hydrogenase gamma subunit